MSTLFSIMTMHKSVSGRLPLAQPRVMEHILHPQPRLLLRLLLPVLAKLQQCLPPPPPRHQQSPAALQHNSPVALAGLCSQSSSAFSSSEVYFSTSFFLGDFDLAT